MTKISLANIIKPDGDNDDSNPILNNLEAGDSDKSEGLPKSPSSSAHLRKSASKTVYSNRGDYDYSPTQFRPPPERIPTKAIIIASILLIVGSCLLLWALAIITGVVGSHEEDDRLWAIIVLGLLVFIPGFYHVRIFVYVIRGVPGYSYLDIPDFD